MRKPRLPEWHLYIGSCTWLHNIQYLSFARTPVADVGLTCVIDGRGEVDGVLASAEYLRTRVYVRAGFRMRGFWGSLARFEDWDEF